jgi:hypothetical protein
MRGEDLAEVQVCAHAHERAERRGARDLRSSRQLPPRLGDKTRKVYGRGEPAGKVTVPAGPQADRQKEPETSTDTGMWS